MSHTKSCAKLRVAWEPRESENGSERQWGPRTRGELHKVGTHLFIELRRSKIRRKKERESAAKSTWESGEARALSRFQATPGERPELFPREKEIVFGTSRRRGRRPGFAKVDRFPRSGCLGIGVVSQLSFDLALIFLFPVNIVFRKKKNVFQAKKYIYMSAKMCEWEPKIYIHPKKMMREWLSSSALLPTFLGANPWDVNSFISRKYRVAL